MFSLQAPRSTSVFGSTKALLCLAVWIISFASHASSQRMFGRWRVDPARAGGFRLADDDGGEGDGEEGGSRTINWYQRQLNNFRFRPSNAPAANGPTRNPAPHGGKRDWSYHGTHGTNDWGVEFPACRGRKQSPININLQTSEYDPTLNVVPMQLANFNYRSSNNPRGIMCNVTHNGHSAAVLVSGPLVVQGGGLPGQFRTSGFHFHWGSTSQSGSEHAIDGAKYPMEMHVVNFNTKYGSLENAIDKPDGLAVLAVMYEVSPTDNPTLYPLDTALNFINKEGDSQMVNGVVLRTMMPADTEKFYRYPGSLTTPGCQESVTWTLFAEKQKISERQLERLRQLQSDVEGLGGNQAAQGHGAGHLVDNFRPLQPLFGRVIKQSFPKPQQQVAVSNRQQAVANPMNPWQRQTSFTPAGGQAVTPNNSRFQFNRPNWFGNRG